MLCKVFRALMLLLVAAPFVRAQDNIPIISGGAGFFGANHTGSPFFQPVIAPVLSLPLGDKWLIESRADLRGFVGREDGTTGPYQGQFFDTLEYLQLDYNVNPHLTITAGRFLAPFGIFNERVSAIWINKLQDAPIVDAIGTGIGYDDGFMVRGALVSNSSYAINYTAFFSTLSTVNKFESQRGAGGRAGLFLPTNRLEVGFSYRRTLQGSHFNSFGTDLSWSPYRLPLEVKGEWAHSPSGYGYWLQASYRLSQLSGADSFLGRFEPVFRMQQFFRTQLINGDSLPHTNTQRPEFGLNYYLPREVRLNASYSRQFVAQSTDGNIWEFGITYRFLFPLWPGASR